jgi:protein O-mannosyl-transferase
VGKNGPPVASGRRSGFWIHAALFVATFAVYAQVRHFDFLNFDDPDYVTGNSHVRHGITSDGLRWAFTSGEAANWFPVTRLTHMLDVQLFGLRSGWHHLTNVLIHALAAMILFAFLQRATRARWPSAFVAFLFALHPLHVESVAWVAERKDVLSALFWFLALWAYVRYAERPELRRYALVLAVFCLGLMSKPMTVTLPLVLLLLDVWPLRRPRTARLLWEKIPFFALSAAVAIATFLVQRGTGAVESLSVHPIAMRVENALVSYVVYIVKMFWPTRLAAFYPYPQDVPAWEAVLAGLAIVAITVLVLRSLRDRPYLAAGWLWFLGTLVPVIGLVQVGSQARADRYMYIPMVGLSIMLAWGAADVVRRWPGAKRPVSALAAAACLSLTAVTWFQLQHWKNSESLFQHAIEVTKGNAVAHHNLGNILLRVPARLPEAVAQLEEALRLEPNSPKVHTDLGVALSKMPGRLPDAIAEYRAALRLEPDSAIVHNNLGNALADIRGGLPLAVSEYETALRLKPDYAEAHNNLGTALSKIGRLPEALAEFEAAVRIDPDYADPHNNIGTALSRMPGRSGDAISEYRAALRIKPDYADAHLNLGVALAELPGRLPEAITEYQAALRIQPDFVKARVDLGSAFLDAGRLPEAVAQYEAAIKIEPGSAEAHYNLGVTLSKIGGRVPEVIAHFEAAIRIDPDYADAHNNLGFVLSQIPGRLPEAIGHFEAALRIRPGYFDAHYNLGVALSQVPGRLPEAISHLEAAQRIRPIPEVQQAIERLRAGQR